MTSGQPASAALSTAQYRHSPRALQVRALRQHGHEGAAHGPVPRTPQDADLLGQHVLGVLNGVADVVVAVDLELAVRPLLGQTALLLDVSDALALADGGSDDATKELLLARGFGAASAFVVVSVAFVVELVEVAWLGHEGAVGQFLDFEDDFAQFAGAQVVVAVDVCGSGGRVEVEPFGPSGRASCQWTPSDG